MKRPSEQLKEVAEEYTNYIVDKIQSKEDKIKLRMQLGLEEKKRDEKSISQKQKSVTSKETVGIWKKVVEGETEFFKRDSTYSSDFVNWAKVKTIPPKGNKYRIAFLGESVARGYLYDPFITPAKVLKKILNNSNAQEFEVIDLAKTSIGAQELENLCKCSINLKPDAIVVFAGNNWRESILPLSDKDIQEIIKAGETKEHFEDLRRIFEKKYKRIVDSFIDTLKELSISNDIPVYFIIPEFNLKDWKRSKYEKSLKWPRSNMSIWFDLNEKAKEALREKDYHELKDIGKKLIKINEINPLGYDYVAISLINLGQKEEARKYLESARDCMTYGFGLTPGIVTSIQDRLKEKCNEENIPVLDLRQVFKEYLNGEIPGNDLFIDYCHLNLSGIKVAMERAAEFFFKIERKDTTSSFYDQVDNLDDVQSKAHFYAAIHCAHRGDQPYEVLLYHCQKSLEHSRNIIPLMKKYMDFAIRKAPWSINKNYLSFFLEGQNEQYPFLIQSNDLRILDVEIMKAMTESLADIGIDLKNEIDKLMLSEHSIRNGKVDLLHTFYSESSYISQYSAEVKGKKSFKVIDDKVTSFYLITEGEKSVLLNLSLRSPYKQDNQQDVKFFCNSKLIGEINVSHDWQNATIVISENILKRGINDVLIDWPSGEYFEKTQDTSYTKGIELLNVKSKPPYGEIFKLTAEEII
ncbi:hypothetical protein COM13_18970 [Bacillus pseudomycoides]|uniref:hypothetical protein n=1 Tax=Bacillus TaxID=1386 RepID=UPI000369E522|nr:MULTISPECIES: hypothetical protein [Bacillus]PDX99233.1 hypothetical protein COO07_17580 [Bacillus pseudomycoides]PEK80747.1 hypothetical protein CN597_10060 [Bacillus pseudomycoides]PEN08109.1 hypothetical protein CN640_13825 [Bacillus pseudomycoides]PGB87548.1 hypothetical protein COM13_18970 [Bacillus pseudomycoides]PGS04524.1 hypothetical protein COC54_12610 [Bacillus pseudomycoides]